MGINSRARLSPFKHQEEAIQALVDNPYFANFSEMGMGKSKITVDAACILFERRVIDRLIIIAPASVRSVWFDSELGELAKHLWDGLNATVTEYHQRERTWTWGKEDPKALQILITNYEYIRPRKNTKTKQLEYENVNRLFPFCGPKTLLVMDESSAVKAHNSAQTEACMLLRWPGVTKYVDAEKHVIKTVSPGCGRVVILNGTPLSNSPQDLFSQSNLLHPSILQCKFITHFRARYASMKAVTKRNGQALLSPRGQPIQVVDSWINTEDLTRRLAPYVLRRMKKDTLDLPEVLPPVTFSVPLTEKTWRYYQTMKKEMVVWLSENKVATATQIIVKMIRLAQITSGFLGGVETVDLDDEEGTATAVPQPVLEIGREKLDFVLGWWKERLLEEPNLKLLVWCRFRPELERMIRAVTDDLVVHQYPLTVGQIHGGQKRSERDEALRLLDPRTAPAGPVFFGGTYGTGALGLNFTACHTVINMSYDYSLYKYLQSAARVDRPGQRFPVSTFDIEAVGPKGQLTIDRLIIKARRLKEDLASLTTSGWINALEQE